MKNICENFCCKKIKYEKSYRVEIFTDGQVVNCMMYTYICHSAPGAFEPMTYVKSTPKVLKTLSFA